MADHDTHDHTGVPGAGAPTEILDIPTAETDASLVLAPDGAGGVEFRAESGGGGFRYPLDTEAAIDATYGDDFDASSLNARWTRRNYPSSESFQIGPAQTNMRISKAGRSAGDGYFQTAPGGDWTFAMAYTLRDIGGSTPTSAWGIACIDSSGTGVSTIFYNSPSACLVIYDNTYSSYGGSFAQVESGYIIGGRKMWVRLRKNGTNFYGAYSLDGEVWGPESSALGRSFTVDRVGMMDGGLGAVTSPAIVDVDWFNKIA